MDVFLQSVARTLSSVADTCSCVAFLGSDFTEWSCVDIVFNVLYIRKSMLTAARC